MTQTEMLNQKYGLNGKIVFQTNKHGFIEATAKGQGGTSTVLLYGAHLTSFIPEGEKEVLWMSKSAEFKEGKAVRGGIPICFPWFGPAPVNRSLPKHGFARLMYWEPMASQILKDGSIELQLTLLSNDFTYDLWPHEFKAVIAITTGRELSVSLHVENKGATEMQYSAALHTYFSVGDAASTCVEGLGGHYYYPEGSTQRQQQKEAFFELSSMVDRCYINHRQPCLIHDTAQSRTIRANKEGSQTTVLWNPWEEGARQIRDIHENGYLDYVCVEAVNTFDDTIVLQPGERHATTAILSVE